MSRFLRQFLGASRALTALPAIDRRLTGELPTELFRLLEGEATLPDTDSSCSTVCVTTSHSINTQVPILWHVLFLLAAAASPPPIPSSILHTHISRKGARPLGNLGAGLVWAREGKEGVEAEKRV